jgi:hypothetical protein
LYGFVANFAICSIDVLGLMGDSPATPKPCCGGKEYDTSSNCCKNSQITKLIPRYEDNGQTLDDCANAATKNGIGNRITDIAAACASGGIGAWSGIAIAGLCAAPTGPGAIVIGTGGGAGAAKATDMAIDAARKWLAEGYCKTKVCPK